MNKTFCDVCGKEVGVKEDSVFCEAIFKYTTFKYTSSSDKCCTLCLECHNDIIEYLRRLQYEKIQGE